MPTRICEYKRAFLSVCVSMPECMRKGTDQMDSVSQWKCKMTTEMLTVAVITAHGHSIKTVDSSSEEWEW